MNIKDLKIRTKIQGLVFIALSAMVIVSIVAIYNLVSLNNYSIQKSGDDKFESFKFEMIAALSPTVQIFSKLLKGIESEEEQIALLQKLNPSL